MSDAHYDKVSLLLPMFGSNNGTVFTDYSPVPKTITSFGNTKTVTTQSKYYGSSVYFDGSGDYLTVSIDTDYIATGNFTIEAWVYTNTIASAYYTIYTHGAATAAIYLHGDKFVWYDGADRCISASIAANTWYHVAAVRQGTTISLYVNGVASGTTFTSSRSFTNTTNTIGANSSAEYFNGYIQDLRVTKGVARYTSNFTPPARLVGQISGMVKDDANANAERIVKAIPRIASNSQIFTTTSAADGTYSLWAPYTEHSVIALDDSAGINYNDLVHRVIPV